MRNSLFGTNDLYSKKTEQIFAERPCFVFPAFTPSCGRFRRFRIAFSQKADLPLPVNLNPSFILVCNLISSCYFIFIDCQFINMEKSVTCFLLKTEPFIPAHDNSKKVGVLTMKNSSFLLLVILLGVLGILVFLPLIAPVTQKILFSIYIICFLTTLILLIRACTQYYKIKTFFWEHLDNITKEYINYGFVRPNINFQTNTKIFFWISKELNFQKKRNELLLKNNPEQGMIFINLEKKINIYLQILFLLLILLNFSWMQL